MTYWCDNCKTVLIEEDVVTERTDESFDAPYGDTSRTEKQYSETKHCPDCKKEVEEH